ncbi:MAG: hemolysin [Thermoanaerobaculia bacterium]|jgi:hemolysin III|nr:hemolysin [Thermoanaerobaculia bacterium]
MYAGERFNSITHIVGTLLAITGSIFAIHAAVTRGADRMTIAAVTIYGLMLIILYLSSTLYHSLRGPAKRVFHVFDHCAIYLLIAGTYTPITLITLRGPWGWWLFAIVWTLAIAGVLKDIFLPGRYRPISVILYVLMGWLVVVAIKPLRLAMPPQGITLIAAGGLVYTLGLVFFALSKHVAHTHGVWHLCVIGGSAFHYFAVMQYVLP